MADYYEKYASGKTESTCRVCGTKGEFLQYKPKEHMIGTGEEFDYFLCSKCGCLQIAEIPENMGEYYAKDYYSYVVPKIQEAMPKKKFEDYYILDVGCGSGMWLCSLISQGYTKLYGCDPFVEKDMVYDNGIIIRKTDIFGMDGQYDYINLGDSFEHMENPKEVMLALKKLLKQNGECYVSIPIIPNIAFDTYGLDWFQIDAPRHFFLHSKKSMEYLCNDVGLRIEGIKYNSNVAQFIRSELYKRGYCYQEHSDGTVQRKISDEQWGNFEKMTELANTMGYGDHAVFKLVHANSEKERGENAF